MKRRSRALCLAAASNRQTVASLVWFQARHRAMLRFGQTWRRHDGCAGQSHRQRWYHLRRYRRLGRWCDRCVDDQDRNHDGAGWRQAHFRERRKHLPQPAQLSREVLGRQRPGGVAGAKMLHKDMPQRMSFFCLPVSPLPPGTAATTACQTQAVPPRELAILTKPARC